MKHVLVVMITVMLSAPFALAHKHKGWGCHKHPSLYGGTIHCGNGSK